MAVRLAASPLLLLLFAAGAAAQDPPPVTSEAPAATATPPVTREDHRELLDRFRARIQELDGKLLLAKAKVDALRERVIKGEVAKNRVVLVHRNEMGEAVVLERATYLLDGGVIFAREDTDGSLDRNKEFEIYNGGIANGEHEVTVSMVFVGRSMGFSTTLKGYKFKVDSKCRFTAEEGKQTRLTVASYAKGDITAQASNQIAVRCDLEVAALNVAPPSPAQ